ncbi:MAG: hypothetical protein Barrevirus18_6 [Barrevirus sp.]|uniref:Uncharacterized protein n=1 Tax=Barrevirus sp. TaxID=2487763 RepID=A0A3G4ZQK9_9VIRU|nr:MAG: hypothetical protein Barrevirus18_6 [Barrevirus sp.]
MPFLRDKGQNVLDLPVTCFFNFLSDRESLFFKWFLWDLLRGIFMRSIKEPLC